MSLVDADPQRSASHRNLAAHLAGPFREGALESTLALAADGTARADWVSRQPLLLVELRARLAEQGFAVAVTVTPDGGPAQTSQLAFAPFSEAGAALPSWIGPASDAAAPFSVQVRATGLPAGAALGDVLALRVTEGVLGRLLYAIGAEKARIRRQARELHELRRLSFHFDDSPDHRRMANALDRHGADLAVPRFADRLAWDAANARPTSETAPEGNEAYRARLELYRPFVLPTRTRVEERLRGYTGAPTATVTEPNTGFAVALQLVSSPTDAPRLAFLAWLRQQHLVQPGAQVPAARLVPGEVRRRLDAALARIGAAFAWPATAMVAPLVVEVLDRIARCRTALGVTRPWKVLHAQDDMGGSRYELGLGVELEVPPAAELDALGAALAAKHFAAGTDPETLAMLATLSPQPSAADRVGRWLCGACGAQTVHATAAGVFVSHAAVFGAALAPDGATPHAFQARFEAPGDPGPNAVLWYGLRDLASDAAAAGVPAWTQLAAPAASAAIGAAALPSATLAAAVSAAGLSTAATADELARAKTALAALPPELIATVQLDHAMATRLAANDAGAVAQLAALAHAAAARELTSVLPLASGSEVLLVIGAVALPSGASLVRSERLAFKWHAVGIQGAAGSLSATRGARSVYTPPPGTAPTLAAVVAVSLARIDRDDPRDRIAPYSARVDVPDGTLIDLPTYERMMNFLERVAPIGVVLDTLRLRTARVDPAGTGHAVPLTGRLAHTFREFQQHRHRGAMPDDLA